MNLDFNFEVVDVWDPSPQFLAISPLERVPVFIFSGEHPIYDSHSIQAWLSVKYEDHPLFQGSLEGLSRRLHFTSLATGIIDLAVQHFLEHRRGPAHSDMATIHDCERALKQAYAVFERELANPRPYLSGDSLRIEDIDLGVAVFYTDFRVGTWLVDLFPNVRNFSDTLAKRKSFSETRPPI